MEFKSKAALGRYVKELLKNREPGDSLSREEKYIMLELIDRHPKAQEKIGCGIANIIIRVDSVWKKSKQFMIVRHDGSMIDFSYKVCLYGECSPLDKFRKACRTAVAEDIIRFKRERLRSDSMCPHLCIPLDKDNTHVDHVKPRTFNWIVSEFRTTHFIQPGDAIIVGEIQCRFGNPAIAAIFRKFHNEVAVLELVSDIANQTVCKLTPTPRGER